MLALATRNAGVYDLLVQEDRVVEWWTAFLFLVAGVVFAVAAWRGRRLGDGGVALFCLAAAGEEVSWGQRIFGFTPSATFLEHNIQQEANLHNLVEAFGQPKWTFVAVLVAYGVLLPLLARTARGQALVDRVRLTVPPTGVALWFGVAALLLVWYPVRLTGEWVEALGGALFLAAASGSARRFTIGATIALGLAIVTERAIAAIPADPVKVACAGAEVAALLGDVRADTASALLYGGGRTHRRLQSIWRDGELDPASARAFRAAPCSEVGGADARRRYGIDPWGSAYWLRLRSDRDGSYLTIYSFGPNRRRDGLQGRSESGDDVSVAATIR